jgi:hypothetical protein
VWVDGWRSERNSAEVTELVNEGVYMNERMNGEGMLVGRKEGKKEGRKEGRKEKAFHAFLTQKPFMHSLTRLRYEEAYFSKTTRKLCENNEKDNQDMALFY